MKSILKSTLSLLANNDLSWAILKPFAVIGSFIVQARLTSLREKSYLKSKEEENEYGRVVFRDLEVLNGPFKGMKYTDVESVGSMIYPKLLGSYEKELWEVIDEIGSNNYTEVIDIGCAEGYYAIGLGLRIRSAKVFAFDISRKARNLCKRMAKINNIEDKLTVSSNCTAEDLENFSFTGKGLIVCDCEGFEKELFNNNNIQNLLNCDLIIETHDFIDISISTYIKNLFAKTHDVYTIKSIDDIEKALSYNFKELNNLGLYERKKLVSELRPAIMEWAVCKAKS
jgi:SAM-dependent methyltransferase